jgi:hypothetical protein
VTPANRREIGENAGMLGLLEGFDGSAAAQRRVLSGVEAHLAAAEASRGRGDREQLVRAEAEVAADPGRAVRFSDSGAATIYADGRSFQAGRFETPALCSLRSRALTARLRGGAAAATARARLWVVDGASAATDIGALQASAPPGSLFQVASQFNCLESPGAYITPVADYLHDPTQGPRASVSAFPGTLARHYAAPDPAAPGRHFVQVSDGPQIELLAAVCAPGVAAVRNGYLRAGTIEDRAAFARLLEERFEAIRVGVHDGVEVALGCDWGGAVDGAPHRTIAQVFTSTVAAGMYGELDEADPASLAICRQLQRAAYLGTLLAAAALGKERVALTLIGGGVFANPIAVIWEAILWAVDQVGHHLHRDLSVVVNGRSLAEQLPPHALRSAARSRGGGLLRIDRAGTTIEA